MKEQGGFSENSPETGKSENTAELPFQAERSLRPSTASDRVEIKLQAISPDKQVIDVANLAKGKVNDQQLSSFIETSKKSFDDLEKARGPLNTVWNNMMRQEMNGEQSGNDWSMNYISKVQEVLRQNMNDLSAEMPFRVAFPVQSFLPDGKGQMKAEMLYALYPPVQTSIHENHITFPLHSLDPQREAQLRNNPSFSSSISSYEQLFRFKVNSLIERKEKTEV